MLCTKPIGVNGATVGCGHCGPCIANRRRLWTGRLLLEQLDHEYSCFATLTYVRAPAFLMPRHLQTFCKRLRYFRGPFRFYGVGEYGSKFGRPHWHIALFGVGLQEAEAIRKAWRGHLVAEVRAVPEGSYGGVHVGELNHDSAQYLCKYMCKDDASQSVVRMSRRPYGIGAGAVARAADGLLTDGGSSGLVGVGDVPRELRTGGQKYPLGQYLRRELRKAVGWNGETPVAMRRKVAQERAAETSEDIALRSRKRAATAINQEARIRRKKVGYETF